MKTGIITVVLAAFAGIALTPVTSGAAQQPQASAASCYGSLVSGTPLTLGAYVESINTNGTVEINGVDTQDPTTAFQFSWGDGTPASSSFFPAQHQYSNVNENYVVTVTATENNGTTQIFSFPVYFVPPPVTPQSISGIAFEIPTQLPTFKTHFPGTTTPPNIGVFSSSSFPVYSSADLASILTAISSIDYAFANKNSFLLNGVFQIDMLENTGTNPDAGLSFWYTTPMSVGYAPSVMVGPGFPAITWYVLFNEVGKDTALNTPTSLTYGGNTDGGGSEIYAETMGDILSYAAGCQLISNASSYGIGADAKLDIQNAMLSGAALLQGTYNQYVADGAPFSSWNPYNGEPDPTIGTFSTLAWKFIAHAEQQGQGYQVPAQRMMKLLQLFDSSMLESYAPQTNSEAAATFRSTLMVTALSYAFSEDLRGEFEALNFPIDNDTFEQLYEMATNGGASLSPASESFGGVNVGSKSAGKTVTLTNYLLTPLTISTAFSGSDSNDFPLQSSSTCPASGTLAANSSCTYVIAFKPTVKGAEAATFSVTETAQDVGLALPVSPESVALSGTGKN